MFKKPFWKPSADYMAALPIAIILYPFYCGVMWCQDQWHNFYMKYLIVR